MCPTRSLLVAVFIVAGCVSQQTEPSPPPPGEARILVGTLEGDTFHDYVDGGDVDLIWGPQGGVMITPVIRFERDAFPAGPLEITLTHDAAPAHPERFAVDPQFASYGFTQTSYAEGGTPTHAELGPLNDQLAWETIHDSWVELSVRLRGGGASEQVALSLHLIDQELANPTFCDRLIVRGNGCAYRRVGGTATVTEVERDTGRGVTVRYSFQADDPEAEGCEGYGPEAGLAVSESCIETLQIDVGSELAVAEMRSIGVCPPDVTLLDECATQ